MQINPPFGYKNIVPFYRNNRVKLPRPGELPAFVTETNAVPISYSEFAVAGRDYPLVFVTSDEGRSFSPVALIGMAGNENLFVKDGVWDPAAYVPAYIRRYPFCMARVTLDNQEQADRLTCIEKSAVATGDDGVLMFDGAGNAVAAWEPIGKLLEEYERDLERTREMCSILTEFGLLEPFTIQATLTGSNTPFSLAGMQRVAEPRIENLNASQLKTMIKKGILGRVYAHLISMDAFGRLLARKAAVQPA